MDEPVATPNILQGIAALPPVLQGLAVLGVAIGVGIFLGRKYLRRLVAEQPEPKVFAAGEPTVFADMSSVKALVANTEYLTSQLVANEAAITGLVTATSQLAELVGGMLLDMREERQERQDMEREQAAEERGYQRGLRTRRATRRKVTKPKI